MVRHGGVHSSIYTPHVVRKTRDSSPVRRIKKLAATEAERFRDEERFPARVLFLLFLSRFHRDNFIEKGKKKKSVEVI